MASASVTATYDLQVLNAMLEVESFFEEMLCEAYDVESEDELPGDITDIDVVKFAELSDDAVRGILERALRPHPFKKAGITLNGIIGATLEKIASAKVKTGKGKWPSPASDIAEAKDAGPVGGGGYKAGAADDGKVAAGDKGGGMVPERQVSMSEEAPGDEAKGGKAIHTARYDLKTMNRIQQINNKFNDQLVELYGVEDEDDLPPAVVDCTFGDVIVNERYSIDDIRGVLEKAIRDSPWPGMNEAKLSSMLDGCMDELRPFAAKLSDISKK
eukprot:CAMPEP_0118963370 /NCGR_PEP_ID=MMETSP1173-20130426/1298_1 /TAXON_ID=1034831 /ORGANISM="Rhizochromulina marina cf, Strain CCMP1243" /LENGTH=271 /DNA_ID=CAMNT_0006911693 /DNA_START=74 /DNA_END=889 /DNA_ORIENTATION=-